MNMKLIAAVDKNWAIGCENKLLVQIPEDMKNFRQMTVGKTVLMGYRTLQSLPGGLALPQRKNIVLTRKTEPKGKNILFAHSVSEALEQCGEEEVYVIGGESIYRQFLPYVSEAYITYIDHAYRADTYLENLDQSEEWMLTEESEEQTYFDLEYYYRIYRKK